MWCGLSMPSNEIKKLGGESSLRLDDIMDWKELPRNFLKQLPIEKSRNFQGILPSNFPLKS